jgi:DNA-binding protein H-NS
MGRVEDLLKQKEQLEKELETAMKEERDAALQEVRKLCKTYGFTPTDLRSYLKTRKRSTAKAKTDDSSS